MTLKQILNRIYSCLLKRKFSSFGNKSLIGFPATLNHPDMIKVGKNVTIREHAWLNCVNKAQDKVTLEIKDGCYIGRFAHINAYKSVILEESVLVADRVFISDVNHQFSDPYIPIIDQGVTTPLPITLKKGCWIGVGAVILPGVTVGENAIVAANAVVTKDVPKNKIARGIPANIYSKNEPKESS